MYAETTRQNLRLIVDAYMAATGASLWTVSREFYGHAKYLEEFFAGERTISVDKLGTMLMALRGKWPDNAIWPDCVAVPMDGCGNDRSQRLHRIRRQKRRAGNNSVETAGAA